MTKAELHEKALELPVEDRMALAEALWASVEREPEQPPLPAWQREVLDRRLAAEEEDPEAGSSWPEVKRRILATL
jgi:putative addiction module component (TIGR02574 family)